MTTMAHSKSNEPSFEISLEPLDSFELDGGGDMTRICNEPRDTKSGNSLSIPRTQARSDSRDEWF